MLSNGVCNPCNVFDHDCRKVDLLTPEHEISEALIHSVSLIAPLAPGDDILNDELKQELVHWLHVTLPHSLRVCELQVLAQCLGKRQ